MRQRLSKQEIQYIIDNAGIISAKQIAKNLNRSAANISRRIKKMGLNAFKSNLIEDGKSTRFKKGNKAHNKKPEGIISIFKINGKQYKKIKIGGKFRHLHRHLWEQYYKVKLKKSDRLIFIDNNTLNCDINNLTEYIKIGVSKYRVSNKTPFNQSLIDCIKLVKESIDDKFTVYHYQKKECGKKSYYLKVKGSQRKLLVNIFYELSSGQKLKVGEFIQFKDSDPMNFSFENLYVTTKKDQLVVNRGGGYTVPYEYRNSILLLNEIKKTKWKEATLMQRF